MTVRTFKAESGVLTNGRCYINREPDVARKLIDNGDILALIKSSVPATKTRLRKTLKPSWRTGACRSLSMR